ncbi:hypothetical protein F5B18DRAFT_657231 [Nemania serpens]|nr:hypothetical protein F5B18DRAFT_657231 [Nemania serpens]
MDDQDQPVSHSQPEEVSLRPADQDKPVSHSQPVDELLTPADQDKLVSHSQPVDELLTPATRRQDDENPTNSSQVTSTAKQADSRLMSRMQMLQWLRNESKRKAKDAERDATLFGAAIDNFDSSIRSISKYLSAPPTDASVRSVLSKTPERSPQPRQGSDNPYISRYIIAQKGNVLNAEKRWIEMTTSEEYERIEATFAGGSAFAMKKHIHTIPPPSNAKGSLGIPALDNDMVDRVVFETIDIRSPYLLNIIKDTVYWPSAAFYDDQKSLTFNSPYRALGVYRDDLGRVLSHLKDQLAQRKLSNSTSNSQGTESPAPLDITLTEADLELSTKHLELLLQEVDKKQSKALNLEKERYSRQMVTFDMLWKLFKPGMSVYADREGSRLACRVKLLIWSTGPSNTGPDDPYQKVYIHLWYLDHDGTCINRRSHIVSIDRFHGEKPIQQLPVYPEEFFPNYKAERKRRIERGQRYLELIENHYFHGVYKGEISVDKEDPYNRQNQHAYHGHVMIDPEQYFRENGGSKSSQWLDEGDVQVGRLGTEVKRFIKLDPIKKSKDVSDNQASVFGDDQFFLLPKWLRGFTIGTHDEHQWVWLHVDRISTYISNKGLVRTVALDSSQINLLKAMTYDPKRNPTGTNEEDHIWSPEQVDGKGTGRIVILHGVPGLGKTYTVECLAEWSGRPLLRLSCAEIGLDPVKLEPQLQSYLRRAERWRAIILMDEADVYMSSRHSDSHSQETALVSVFLRALEYYAGIIFLTTNRIRVIDRAVINRALLIMEYKRLHSSQIATIVGNCIRFVTKGGQKIDEGAAQHFKEVLDEQSKATGEKAYDWDGREIVQVLTMAVRLAAFEHYNTSPAVRADDPLVNIDHINDAMRVIRGHGIPKDGRRRNENFKREGYDNESMG